MHNEPTNSHQLRATKQAPPNSSLLTVGGAADLLGVHANTVRAWTDQGLITCLRINKRGDRRYRHEEIERFLDRAGRSVATPAHGDAAPSEPHRALTRRARVVRTEPEAARTRAVLDEIARVCAESDTFERMVGDVAIILCAVAGYRAAALVGDSGRATALVGRMRSDRRVVNQVMTTRMPAIGPVRRPDPSYKVGLPVCAVDGTGLGSSATSVLLLDGGADTRTPGEMELLSGVAAQLATANRMRQRITEASAGRRRAELLMAISSDIGSQLDLPHVLSQLADRANDLFEADHTGVFSRMPDGRFTTRATHNLSADFCQMVEHASVLPASALAFEEGRVVSVMNYPDDARALELRHGVVKEGINTITVAPMLSNGVPLGVLALFYDTPHEWDAEQSALLEQLARQAATMLRNAQNYSQMATWAAQIQSIQQLGSKLTRLRTVGEIGHAICAELNQLIDYHNVRVYRVDGEECIPVAWRGEIGEYEGEDMEQLRLRVGEGITGWVARQGLAQNVGDAANDHRARTIPGTEGDGLDESLLLAPMLYEDDVMGVIVLAKLGLNQFTADDLRLLEIYASIAAQAMANADVTERLRAQSEALERQLNSQRELLRVTESILSTLDTQALLEEIAERLKSLVQVDNIAVDIHDQRARLLRPIFARGVHALDYLASTIKDTAGVAGAVLRSGEAELVADEMADSRVAHFAGPGPLPGALIVVPLRSGDRVQGLLTIERLGTEARFSEEEFDLVKLFAAHVSIALQNAEAHRAVELKAETDTLTGLWNHGALISHIDRLVSQQARFSMLMVDLDFFKRYNDRFGHQAGNVVLQEIATLLRGSGRESDQVFRYGGDEFALLLPGTSLVGARIVAQKIQAAVETVNDGRLMPTPLTCSIGLAVFPKDGRDGESIILAADRACYAGKRGGRARIATAVEGLALAAEFEPTEPTRIQSPTGLPAYTLA
jgi:diguanylate cyclase (GGDEF)-like protein/excisionase family DNA binding protein